jgi:hypothetical protein
MKFEMSDPLSPGAHDSAGDLTVETVDTSSTSNVSAAVIKFKSCRWRRPPEDGPECCGHRDVLPMAGTSFNPEAWCPDCTFFKLRRTPKKRNPDEYRY